MPKAEPRGFLEPAKGARIRAPRALVLTGPSGAGKSMLASWLGRQGWKVLDGDSLARGLYVPGSRLLQRVAQAFPGVLDAQGNLDRPRLAALAFKSTASRRRLTRLAYPPFLAKVRHEFSQARKAGRRIVADMAVYFDAGAPALGARVLLVDAPMALRIKRLRARGLGSARARAQAGSLRFGRPERAACDLLLDGNLAPQVLRQKLRVYLAPRPLSRQ